MKAVLIRLEQARLLLQEWFGKIDCWSFVGKVVSECTSNGGREVNSPVAPTFPLH